MNVVYRVFSPSRRTQLLTTTDRSSADAATAELNEGYRKMSLKADWRVQRGSVTDWRDE